MNLSVAWGKDCIYVLKRNSTAFVVYCSICKILFMSRCLRLVVCVSFFPKYLRNESHNNHIASSKRGISLRVSLFSINNNYLSFSVLPLSDITYVSTKKREVVELESVVCSDLGVLRGYR